MYNKYLKSFGTVAIVYYCIAAIPVLIYLLMVAAALIFPPQICRDALESPAKEVPFQKVCKNPLSRPVMYIYPIIFLQFDD